MVPFCLIHHVHDFVKLPVEGEVVTISVVHEPV